jgi:hypothetical protein
MNQIVAEKKFIQERLGIPYENLSQSYLQAETQLTNLSSYQFQLQSAQVSNPNVTDQLLKLNDQFVISHFRVGLKYIDAASPSDTEQLDAEVYTFADPNAFTANAANAASIFNSFLSFTIDRKQYLPQFPCHTFYRVPTAQSSWFAGATNGYDNGLYGFYPSEPTLIDGRQTLNLSLQLGAAVDIATAGEAPYVAAVFQVRGYLVVNAKS